MIYFTFPWIYNDFPRFLEAKSNQNRSKKQQARWNASFCLYQKRQDALGWLKMPPSYPEDAPKTTSWLPRRPQNGFPAPQDAPQDSPKTSLRRFQDGPRCLQEGSNCAQLLQRPSRSPPDLDFGPSGPRSCTLQTSM